MKHKLYLLIVIFLALILFPVESLAAGASLSVSGRGDYSVGNDITSSVSIDTGGNKVCAINFDLSYPSNLLELKGIPVIGSVYNLATEQNYNSPGTIHYQLGSAGCSNQGSVLITAVFTAKASGSGNLSLSGVQVLGGDDGSLEIAATGGSTHLSVTTEVISTPTTTPAPTATPKKTSPTPMPTKSKTISPTPTPSVQSLADPALTSVEFSVDATLDQVESKSKGILFSGTAEANSKINILIQSDPISATAQTDNTGKWSYLLDAWLPDGNHKITLSSEKDNLKSKEVVSDFVVGSESRNQIAIGTVFPTVTPSTSIQAPATNTSKNGPDIKMIAIISAGAIVLIGMVLIILFTLKRKKYLTAPGYVGQSITQAMQSPANNATNTNTTRPETKPTNFVQQAPSPVPVVPSSLANSSAKADDNPFIIGSLDNFEAEEGLGDQDSKTKPETEAEKNELTDLNGTALFQTPSSGSVNPPDQISKPEVLRSIQPEVGLSQTSSANEQGDSNSSPESFTYNFDVRKSINSAPNTSGTTLANSNIQTEKEDSIRMESEDLVIGPQEEANHAGFYDHLKGKSNEVHELNNIAPAKSSLASAALNNLNSNANLGVTNSNSDSNSNANSNLAQDQQGSGDDPYFTIDGEQTQ